MDETAFDRSRSGQPESPVLLPMFSRNDDPMTLRLRSEGALDLDELVSLQRATSPLHMAASSSGTRTTGFSSSRKESTMPTSAGTSYPVVGYTGKGKAAAQSVSSLSATHGSASEAEADVEALFQSTVFGLGDWMADGRISASALRGPPKTRRPPPLNRPRRQKKPPVVIHHADAECTTDEEYPAAAKPAAHHSARDVEYLRYRRTKLGRDDGPDACEEARPSRASAMTSHGKPLSRARSYIVMTLVMAIVLTFALSTFAAHHTGKVRMGCTKGIIFSASVLISWLTIGAMVVAQHGLQTALLAALLEFAIGFALVVQIHDFM